MGLNTNNAVSMTLSSAGVVNIPNLTASQDVQTDGSKNLVSVSDENWKNDYGPVTGGLAIVNSFKPHYFDWIRDSEGPIPDFYMVGKPGEQTKVMRPSQPRLAGFFSQEVHAVFPEGAPGGANVDANGEEHWGLNSRAILAAVVAGMQELDKKVEAMV
jgi:hypothetical protein